MNFLPLAELPPRLNKKIILSDPTKSEDDPENHWLWIGSFVEPKTRHKHYMPAHDEAQERQTWGCKRNVRGMPNAHEAEIGYAVPAHRVVYARALRMRYALVPRLSRCANDRCVSPHHTEILPVSRSDGVLEVLKDRRPATFMSIEAAAEECGLPEIPPEIWTAYVLWDEANSEDDDA